MCSWKQIRWVAAFVFVAVWVGSCVASYIDSRRAVAAARQAATVADADAEHAANIRQCAEALVTQSLLKECYQNTRCSLSLADLRAVAEAASVVQNLCPFDENPSASQ